MFLVAAADPSTAQLVTGLPSETEKAFEAYIAAVEPALLQEARRNMPLPWLGQGPADRVRSGETVIRSVTGETPHPIEEGLIHDWLGGIYFAGARLEQAGSVLQNFARHKDWYPEVIESRLIQGDRNQARGSWLLQRKSVITVVLRAELDSRLVAVDPANAYLVSKSLPIVEVDEYGEPGQRDLPPREGHGFLWRFNAYWNLHQVDGGVFAECRVISLSRAVPTGLGFLVNPFVRSMPRDSLRSTLEHTRTALKER